MVIYLFIYLDCIAKDFIGVKGTWDMNGLAHKTKSWYDSKALTHLLPLHPRGNQRIVPTRGPELIIV